MSPSTRTNTKVAQKKRMSYRRWTSSACRVPAHASPTAFALRPARCHARRIWTRSPRFLVSQPWACGRPGPHLLVIPPARPCTASGHIETQCESSGAPPRPQVSRHIVNSCPELLGSLAEPVVDQQNDTHGCFVHAPPPDQHGA